MKKVLFNCSSAIVGGGIKNAAFFIQQSEKNTDFDWYYAISAQVNDLILDWGINISSEKILVFTDSPSRSMNSRKALLNYTKHNEIELVYTMSGPAYVKFPVVHILGISNAYITHADWQAFRLRGNLLTTFKYYLFVSVQFWYAIKADYFIFQTNFAKNSFKKRTFFKDSRLKVIPNAYDSKLKDYFDQKSILPDIQQKKSFVIFCPGAHYPHKGLQFIPKIAFELNKISSFEFKFILTLPESKVLKKIEEEIDEKKLYNRITNIGTFNYTQLVKLLEDCDIVFVPSLLETFSASYLEAVCAHKPLVVADKLFARDVCGSYAIYVNPFNFRDVAAQFDYLFKTHLLNNEKAKIGHDILKKFGSHEDRFKHIIEYTKQISATTKN